MRPSLRDAVAALLVAAILTPYAGFLVRRRVPDVVDVCSMVTFLLRLAIPLIAGGCGRAPP